MKDRQAMGARERGFSLIEMTVSMAVLLIVVGAVLQLLSQSQQRNVATATVQDTTAMTRESLDQMVREIRLAGYPPLSSYQAGVIDAASDNLNYVAEGGGFLAAADYTVQFEADIDNSGLVTVIDYALQVPTGEATGGCAGLTENADLTSPTLMRSAVPKNGDGSAVATAFEPFLENVRNCELGDPPIFAYCPAPPTGGGGATPAGCPDMSQISPTLLSFPQDTRIVMVRLWVQSPTRDPQTGQFYNVEFFGLAHRVNPDQ